MNQEQKEKLELELDRLCFFLLELNSQVEKARIQVLNILREVKKQNDNKGVTE